MFCCVQSVQATFKSIRAVVPLLDRVLVQRFKPETVRPLFLPLFPPVRRKDSSQPVLQKTATGIFLPSSTTSTPLPEATVIAVGPGAPDKEGKVVPTSVKPGDRVLLPGWGGNPIKVGEDVSVYSFALLCWMLWGVS